MVAAVAIVDTSAIVGVAESLWAGRRQLYGKPADRIHNATCDLGHVASLKLTKKEMTYRRLYEMGFTSTVTLVSRISSARVCVVSYV